MRKRLIVILLFCFVILTGCFSDPVQDDLLQYVNSELTTAHKLERTAITAFESVAGTNFTNDQALYDALQNEVIPNYEKFLNELNSVDIETEELKELHDLYIEGANTQMEAFLLIVTALEKQDQSLIEEANKLLEKGKKQITDYNNKIRQLAKDHNVTLEEEEN